MWWTRSIAVLAGLIAVSLSGPAGLAFAKGEEPPAWPILTASLDPYIAKGDPTYPAQLSVGQNGSGTYLTGPWVLAPKYGWVDLYTRPHGGTFSSPRRIDLPFTPSPTSRYEVASDATGTLAAYVVLGSHLEATFRPPGGPWEQMVELGRVTTDAPFPSASSLSVNGGSAVIGWETSTGAIKVARHQPDGWRSSEMGSTDYSYVSLRVSMDPDGGTLAVWGTSAIYASFAAAGQPFGPAQKISDNVSFDPNPVVTPGGGHALFVFSRWFTGQNVVAATLENGNFTTTDLTNSPWAGQGTVSAGMNASGEAVVAWSQSAGDCEQQSSAKCTTTAAEATRYSPATGWSTPARLAESSTLNGGTQAGIDANGHVLVAWPRFVSRAGCRHAKGCSVLLEGRASGGPLGYCPREQINEVPRKGEYALDELAASDHLFIAPNGEALFLLANDLRSRRRVLGEGCLPPPNAITLGRTVRDKRHGSAVLEFNVPGPGRLTASGQGMQPQVVSVERTGAARLTVQATGSVAKELDYTGLAGVRALVKFTPIGGSTSSQLIRVKLKKSTG